ncbi:hypothetical protein CHS0354_024821 [Potamilus streckersoni]|uniref:Uncharacterized protein n=1 Tax=Potamilus streckersoni TaxID=2493646 RepID=A0AAE0SZS6_9BIVA|nr:hypothetical protein CHS0354_024821 [Potamilus streckersoni]
MHQQRSEKVDNLVTSGREWEEKNMHQQRIEQRVNLVTVAGNGRTKNVSATKDRVEENSHTQNLSDCVEENSDTQNFEVDQSYAQKVDFHRHGRSKGILVMLESDVDVPTCEEVGCESSYRNDDIISGITVSEQEEDNRSSLPSLSRCKMRKMKDMTKKGQCKPSSDSDVNLHLPRLGESRATVKENSKSKENETLRFPEIREKSPERMDKKPPEKCCTNISLPEKLDANKIQKLITVTTPRRKRKKKISMTEDKHFDSVERNNPFFSYL